VSSLLDDNRNATVQPDGKILLVGGLGGNTAVARLLASGSADPLFGVGGVVTHDFGHPWEAMFDATLGREGRIIATGWSWAGGIQARALGFSGSTMSDYVNTGTAADRDWEAPVTTNMFGACLRSVANATPDWTTTGSCTATDTDPWNDIDDTPSIVAHTTTTGTINASASFRFGMRTSNAQAVGSWVAPLTVAVVAP
jgi:hypothetical protein